jgi:hypothetical protein
VTHTAFGILDDSAALLIVLANNVFDALCIYLRLQLPADASSCYGVRLF